MYDYNINNIDYNKYPDLKFVKASNLGFDVINKNISKASGINSVMSVHDCYGTLAPDTDLSAKYNVRNIPTVVVVDDNDVEIKRFSGTKTETDLNKFFDDI